MRIRVGILGAGGASGGILAAVLVVAGCQSSTVVRMYSGPDVPPEQLAMLVVPWCIGLKSVDGLPGPATLADELRLMVKPGPHTVVARFVTLYPVTDDRTDKIVSDYVTVTFTAEAGKTYTMCSRDPRTLEDTVKYASNVSLWVEEEKRGERKALPVAPPAGSGMSTPATPEAPAAVAAPPGTNAAAEADLLKVWDKSSEQERRTFLEKIGRTPR